MKDIPSTVGHKIHTDSMYCLQHLSVCIVACQAGVVDHPLLPVWLGYHESFKWSPFATTLLDKSGLQNPFLISSSVT